MGDVYTYSVWLGTGFGKDEGASLLLAFRGLQSETAAQGQIHKTIAHELDTLVADPFDSWAQGYKVSVVLRPEGWRCL